MQRKSMRHSLLARERALENQLAQIGGVWMTDRTERLKVIGKLVEVRAQLYGSHHRVK